MIQVVRVSYIVNKSVKSITLRGGVKMKRKMIINLLLILIILPIIASSRVNAEEINSEVAEMFMEEQEITPFSSRTVTGSRDGYNFIGTLDVSNPWFRNPRASATIESLNAPMYEIFAQVKVFVNDNERGAKSCRLRNATKCSSGEVIAPDSSTAGLRFWGSHSIIDANLSSNWTGFTRYIY